jgi:hypothetical protein
VSRHPDARRRRSTSLREEPKHPVARHG